MTAPLRGLPRIGPSAVIPAPAGEIPACNGCVILAYTLAAEKWCLYNHGQIYADLATAMEAAEHLPRVYVHVHVLPLKIGAGKIEVRS